MPTSVYETSVFLNCPFDEEFEPILQAMLFCIVYLGLTPRLSSESNDSGANRLEKICNLIENCLYSIHDLSRCEATEIGEIARLNMPFELGIDYGVRRRGCRKFGRKKFLVLDEKQYRYQKALSDFAGFDIKSHNGKFDIAVSAVRNWLVSDAGVIGDAPNKILSSYIDFQAWNYELQLSKGFSEEDIMKYPTRELLDAMNNWFEAGKPMTP